MATPHEVLGLSPGASEKEIKAAYKKLAKKHHPDVNGGDDKKFKEIGQAYEALTKPQPEPSFAGGGFAPFFDESIFNDLFRNAGFGGGGFGFHNHVVHRQAVDPDILINGGTLDFATTRIERVQGRIKPVNHTHKVTIEPDTPVMSRVAVPNGNQFTFLELVAGDTLSYRVSDIINLTKTESISVFKAMMGGEVEVIAPNRKKMKIRIPAGTQAGSIHRMRGLGLRLPDGRRGDFNVQFVVHIPAITGTNTEEIQQRLLDSYLEHAK